MEFVYYIDSMKRDFIIVVGNQGCGKSVWSKLYSKSHSRLLVFDPMASYPGVIFSSPVENWIEDIANGAISNFRSGSSFPDDLPVLAFASFGAGNCTLVVEECAFIFRRGEELHDWAKPLIFVGRHQAVSLVLVSQRASKIPIDIRSQASRIVSFRQTEPSDVSAITERMGESVYDEIFSLPDLHCVDWNEGNFSRYSINPKIS